ncbi:MAG: hypothetical protein RSA24_03405, partial [Clostridia bacterium]
MGISGTPQIDVVKIACARYNEKHPDNILTEEQFVQTLVDYSILTIDLQLTATINTADKTVNIGGIDSAFGGLFKGLLCEMIPANSPLWDKFINFNGTNYTLSIAIRGVINTRDAAKTNLAVEITDAMGGDKVRAGIYYIGAEEAVFADLSGMLGEAGKIKLTNINLNKIMNGLISGLIDKLEAAINKMGETAADELAD